MRFLDCAKCKHYDSDSRFCDELDKFVSASDPIDAECVYFEG